MSKVKKCIPCEEYDHPSIDRSDRFAVDALIRASGYQIFRRNKGQTIFWIKKGKIYSEQQVLKQLDQERLWGAQHREYLYLQGFPCSIDLSSEDVV